MYRRAFARHRIGAALLLGLSLRAPSASAEPTEPRVGTVEGKAAEVRGAPPGNVGYLLDRARVPHLYHIGFAPSVIHLDGVDGVELYPSGYAARFGRFAGGVVTAPTRGPEPALSRGTSLRLFEVDGLLVPPFTRGRGSLLSALLSLFSREVTFDARDYPARATHEPIAPDRFSVLGFDSFNLRSDKRSGILTRLGDACRPRITFTW